MKTDQDVDSAAPSAGHVEEVVRSAERELRQLLHQRAETMKRIGTVKQTLVCLAKVFGDTVLTPEAARLLGRGATRKQPGFTRACRMVLMEAGMPLDARQGYQELQRRFPELDGRHKDPLASVTTVFNRLVGYAEVRTFLNQRGRRVWEWIADPGRGAENLLPSLEAGPMPQPQTMTKQ